MGSAAGEEEDGAFWAGIEEHLPAVVEGFMFVDVSAWAGEEVEQFEAKMSAFIRQAVHLCCLAIKLGSLRLHLVLLLLLGGYVDGKMLRGDAKGLAPEQLYKRNSHKWRGRRFFYGNCGCPRSCVILGRAEWFWAHEEAEVVEKAERMLGLRVVVQEGERLSGELVEYKARENLFGLAVDGGEVRWVDLNQVPVKFIKSKARYKVCEKEYLRNSEADVGVEVRVYWPQDDTWWHGTIIAWTKQTGHRVRYSDGDEREYADLVERKFEIIKSVDMDVDEGEELVDEVHKALGNLKLRHPKFVAASSVESKIQERAANHSFHEEEVGDEEELDTEASDAQPDENAFSIVLPIPAEEQTKMVSWHLLEAVEFLASSGGCDMLCHGLGEAVAAKDDVHRGIVLIQLLCLELVMPFLKESYRTELAHVVYSSGVQYLMDLTPEQAIECPLNDFVVIADVISRINLFAELDYRAFCDKDRMGIKSRERRSLVEKFLMNLSAKYLSSNILDKRIFGLETILQGVRNVSPSRGIGFGLSSAAKKTKCIELTSLDDKDWVVKWMLDNRIVDNVYAPDRLHAEIARRSNALVLLLAHEQALTSDHLRCLWRLAITAPDETASLVKSLLLLVIPLLPRQLRIRFFQDNVLLCNMADPPLRFVYKLTLCALDAEEREREKEKDKEGTSVLRKKGSSATEVEEGEGVEEDEAESRSRFYGLYPLWEFIQAEKSSLEQVHSAITYVVQLLDERHCGSEQRKVVELCISNLSQRRVVPQSLQVLSKLISTLPRHRNSWFSRDYKNQETVISALEKNFNLLNLLVEELIHFHGQPTALGPFPYLLQLRTRLDFLLFVLSRTPCRLSKSNVDHLWALYVSRAHSNEARDLVLAWFGKAHAAGRQPNTSITSDEVRQGELAAGPVESLESLTRTALTEEAVKFLFEQRLPQMEVGNASMIGLRVFLSFFIATNVKSRAISLSQSPNEEYNLLSRRNRRKRTKRKAVAKIASTVFASFSTPDLDNDESDSVISSFLRSAPKLPGEDTLWQLALCVENEDVALTAIDTLVHFQLCIHAKLKAKTGRIRSDFIQACMHNITLNTNADTSQLLKLKQKRAALMLKNLLLSSVSTKASKPISLRVLPPAFDQPGSLTRRHWTPLSQTLSARLDVPHNITLADLRSRVCQAVDFTGDPSMLRLRVVNSCDKSSKEKEAEVTNLGQVLSNELSDRSIDSLGVVDGSTIKLMDVKVNSNKPARPPPHYELTLGYAEDVARYARLLPKPSGEPEERLLEFADGDGLGELHSDLLRLLDMGMGKGVEKEKVIMDTATSRDIWDCVNAVPIGSSRKEAVLQLQGPMEEVFPADRLHSLVVSLQIVQQLPRQVPPGAVGEWCRMFIAKGGLQHLSEILANHEAFTGERRAMCMSLLLSVLSGVLDVDEEYGGISLHTSPAASESGENDSAEPRFKRLGQMLRLSKQRPPVKGPEEKLEGRAFVGRLSLDLCSMVSTIMELILHTATPHSGTGLDQVVLYGMRLVQQCIAVAGADGLQALYSYSKLDEWTEQLLLLNTDSSARVAAANCILDLCKTDLGDMAVEAPATFFCGRLIPLLEKCLQGDIDASVFHRSCDEYFSLLTELVGLLDVENLPFDLHDLYQKTLDLFQSNLHHTHYTAGFLHLFHTLLHVRPSLVNDPASTRFCLTLYQNMLFPFGFHEHRSRRPKCHTQHTRTLAFALLLRLSTNAANLRATLQCMRTSSLRAAGKEARERLGYEWEVYTKNVVRGRAVFSGLENKGTTCYMNAFLQQLHKTPHLKEELLTLVPGECESEDGDCFSTIHALQMLMESLSLSTKDFVSTGLFCECLRDYDGSKISLTEQKDVSEFGALLFDRLEQENKAATAVLKRHFGGELINHIVSKDERHEYSSETKEPFYILPLDIKGKKTLGEALDGFVKGEIMTGQNRYQLPSGENVDALKRSGIATFPKHFVFSLKRFEFDHVSMKTRKLNDHFRFPLTIDLTKYKYDEDDLEDYQYELNGILAHSGTSDSGHYYSFIRQRSSPGLVEEEREWFEFNDTMVWPYPEDRIALDCYGGTVKTDKIINGEIRSELTIKNNNAFMLFYDRKPLPETPANSPASSSRNALEVKQVIENENLAYEHDNHIFSNDTMVFMWNLAHSVTSGNVPALERRETAGLLMKYFLSIVVHSAVREEILVNWRNYFFRVFHGSVEIAEEVLMAMDVVELQAALTENPCAEGRQIVAEVVAFAVGEVMVRTDNRRDKTCHGCICGGRLDVVCCRIVKLVVQCVVASVADSGGATPVEVCWLLSTLAMKYQSIRVVALGHPRLLETLVKCILELLSVKESAKGKGAQKGWSQTSDLYSILQVAGLLVRSAPCVGIGEAGGTLSPNRLKPEMSVLSDPLRHVLMTNVYWLRTLVETSAELASLVLGHLCWSSDLSDDESKLFAFCIESVRPTGKGDLDYLPYLRVLGKLLMLKDGAETERCSQFVPKIINHCHTCLKQYDGEDFAFFASRFLLTLAASSEKCRLAILNLRETWEGWPKLQRKLDNVPSSAQAGSARVKAHTIKNVAHRDPDYLENLKIRLMVQDFQ